MKIVLLLVVCYVILSVLLFGILFCTYYFLSKKHLGRQVRIIKGISADYCGKIVDVPTLPFGYYEIEVKYKKQQYKVFAKINEFEKMDAQIIFLENYKKAAND